MDKKNKTQNGVYKQIFDKIFEENNNEKLSLQSKGNKKQSLSYSEKLLKIMENRLAIFDSYRGFGKKKN